MIKQYTFSLILMILFSGCFVQNFNKNSRLAQYDLARQQEIGQHPNNKVLEKLLWQQQQWSKTPYVYGGTQKTGADCSGFVMQVFKQSFQIKLPRITIDQMKKGKKIGGHNIAIAKLRAGDLLFFKTNRGEHGYHVGIYLENGSFMHLSTKGGAKIANLSNNYWKKTFKKAIRYPIT